MIKAIKKNNQNKHESLTVKTVKSSLWMIGSTGFLSLIKIIFVFILARLLRPEDFGIFSLATIFFKLESSFPAPKISNSNPLGRIYSVCGHMDCYNSLVRNEPVRRS